MLATSIWLWTEQGHLFEHIQHLLPVYDYEQSKGTCSNTHNACCQHMTMNRTKRCIQQHTTLAARVRLWTEQRDMFNNTQCLQPGYDHEQNKETRSTTHNACSQCVTVNRTRRHVQQHATLATNVWLWTNQRDMFKQNTCSQRMTMTINRTKRHTSVRLNRTKRLAQHLQPVYDYEQNKETCTTLAASVRLWTEQRDLHNTCSQWMATNRKKRLVQHLQPVYDYEQNKETCTTLAASVRLWTEQRDLYNTCSSCTTMNRTKRPVQH